jgi:hypothetical protein
VQARKYKGLILRFNADIAEKNVGIHSAAYLFNLVRRKPEPLEDARYRHIIDDTHLFLADDADALSRYIEKYVRHRSRHDVLFLLEKGRLIPAPALVECVGKMLDGNEEFELLLGSRNAAAFAVCIYRSCVVNRDAFNKPFKIDWVMYWKSHGNYFPP